MICIIDYGMGNLLSVRHAVESLGATVKICNNPEELGEAERLILPGVGAFRDCIGNLRSRGFADVLTHLVLERRKPILGICLGMQVMASTGFEGGEYSGLGWLAAEVVRLQPNPPALRIPHIGWNDVESRPGSPLFKGLPPTPCFYFVHSYHMKCRNPEEVDATCDYGGVFTCAVRKGNIFATQFHPEKSQDHGLKFLENFLRWRPN
jgi:glutamine amidotransferase